MGVLLLCQLPLVCNADMRVLLQITHMLNQLQDSTVHTLSEKAQALQYVLSHIEAGQPGSTAAAQELLRRLPASQPVMMVAHPSLLQQIFDETVTFSSTLECIVCSKCTCCHPVSMLISRMR